MGSLNRLSRVLGRAVIVGRGGLVLQAVSFRRRARVGCFVWNREGR